MSIKFCPIASSSSGNCIYIGTSNTHILIDAGLSGVNIQKGLVDIDIDASILDAIFITHEHSDHVKGAGVLSRRFNIPIFATQKTWEHIERSNSLGKIADNNRCFVYVGENCIINDMSVNAFNIPHAAADPVGYTISAFGHKVAVATDIGFITDTIKENIENCSAILIESNHDIEMLENGKYPRDLKNRIRSNKGHLSNCSTGQFLAEIMNERLKHIYLGHLSEENNRPLIALDTVTSMLKSVGAFDMYEFKLCLAERECVSEACVLS
ncbi:MAG: MBL fold metallo-hydrolase [Defluviitaleaceae bacterium]|nr:MBL fold metallo-hydrolase [Defluviitaleaceae bacterium]